MVRNGALRNEQSCQRRSYGNLSGGAGEAAAMGQEVGTGGACLGMGSSERSG